MLTVGYDERQLNELAELFGDGQAKKMKRQLHMAINQTSKDTKRAINKNLRAKLAIKSAPLNKMIYAGKTSGGRLSARVTLAEYRRPNLAKFSAQQTKTGVSAKINTGGGTTKYRSGFIIDSYGKKAYARRSKARGPLVQLRGPSPVGAFWWNKLMPQTLRDSEAALHKRIDGRIRTITRKMQGKY